VIRITGVMAAIEEIERKLLALPLKHRVFLAESLLASVLDREMTPSDEMAEVERREMEIESGKVQALTDTEFWQEIEAVVPGP
jgi:hypothetical protein